MKDFVGTKIALTNGDRVLSILRDNVSYIPYPGMWDLPGGGREKNETPFQTVQREVREELNIKLKPSDIIWQKVYPGVVDPTTDAVFMVANIMDEQIHSVNFDKGEGEKWQMMGFEEFINHKNAVPGMQTRLRDYLAQK